jgi:hypothetical protein
LNTNPLTTFNSGSATLLEESIAKIERQLATLGAALRQRDALAIESEALALQRALTSAVHRLSAAAQRDGGVPLRRRLAQTSGEIAAQRESLRRASAALDRALDVLLPPDAATTAYAPDGARSRAASTGAVGA